MARVRQQYSNLSTIGLGTKPGRSLSERLTNAIDAILEDRAPNGIDLPTSPRLATQNWFGRPITGVDSGLFKWNYAQTGIDKRIHVLLQPGGTEAAPTVDVLDDGVGIAPEEFPATILSLQAGNKITKRYLVGSFGQGGAATLAFCDFALIVSRHRANPQKIGFTVVRVLNLSDTYKEDCYAYLALSEPRESVLVPFCEGGDLTPYTSDETRVPTFSKGTLVRHYGYKLDGLTGTLAPSPGNLYHYLHTSMFDPLLPFRVVDLRSQHRSEVVTGSRNRLMKLTSKQLDPTDEAGSEVRHHREMEYVMPLGEHDAPVGVEYWVVLNYRKGRGSKKDQVVLRSQSSELYVEPTHPILGTLNGQNQGELTAQILRDLGLTMVSRHMVIHFDASECHSRIRRQLFSTSREGFKDGPVLTHLMLVLRKMLEEDTALFAIERELTEKIAAREAQTTSDEVRRQVTKLLLDAGFQLSHEGPGFTLGKDEPQPVRPKRPGKPVRPDPLPTLPFPEVTQWRIVVPQPQMEIHIGDIEVVLVETDADAEFDQRGLVSLRVEPPLMDMVAKRRLRGGRVRWRLKTTDEATVDSTGTITATITLPDGTQLVDSVVFRVLPPLEDKSKKTKGQVPPFEIVPINPDDHPDKWSVAWPDLSEDVPFEQQQKVAYKPVRLGGGITVFYSTIFSPFSGEIQRLKTESPVLMDLFRTNYEIWIGYHAILQEAARPQDGADIDSLLETERAHVARMQVKQALKTADLMRKLMKEEASAGLG